MITDRRYKVEKMNYYNNYRKKKQEENKKRKLNESKKTGSQIVSGGNSRTMFDSANTVVNHQTSN